MREKNVPEKKSLRDVLRQNPRAVGMNRERGRRPFRSSEKEKSLQEISARHNKTGDRARRPAAGPNSLKFAAEETRAAKFPLGDGKFSEALHSPFRHGNPRVQTPPAPRDAKTRIKNAPERKSPRSVFRQNPRTCLVLLLYAPFTARADEKTTFCALPRQRARARPKMRRPPPVQAPCKPGCPPRPFRR